MATYSSQEVYRPDLALALEQYDETADQQSFVGLKIAPVYDTRLGSGEYPISPIGSMLVNVDDERAASGDYPTVDGHKTWDNYTTKDRGVAERVDDRNRSLNLSFWDDEVEAARRTRHAVLLNNEKRIIQTALSSAVASTALDNGKRYTVYADATPVDDIQAAVIAIREACGSKNVVMVADWETITHIKRCEQVLDHAAFGQGSTEVKSVSDMHLAKILKVEEVIEANAMKNTTLPGPSPAAAVLKPTWPRNQILLFVRNRGRDTRAGQFMRTFHYSADGSRIGGTFETWYSADKRSHMVRHRLDVQEKVIYAACARRITNCTAAE